VSRHDTVQLAAQFADLRFAPGAREGQPLFGRGVALVQAGTFRSDAGTLFGPVPWVLWGSLVTDEVDDRRSATARGAPVL